jgi:hypothetical protein
VEDLQVVRKRQKEISNGNGNSEAIAASQSTFVMS